MNCTNVISAQSTQNTSKTILPRGYPIEWLIALKIIRGNAENKLNGKWYATIREYTYVCLIWPSARLYASSSSYFFYLFLFFHHHHLLYTITIYILSLFFFFFLHSFFFNVTCYTLHGLLAGSSGEIKQNDIKLYKSYKLSTYSAIEWEVRRISNDKQDPVN